jgi:hypothetical protein
MRLIHFACFAALAAFLLPAAVFGVDGVILIDQNKALAGNVTPGDTPGFPVTISQPGSYRLDSNLTVPDVNTTAIVIAADNVTIDLNGFAILGNNVCAFVSINGSISFSCIPGGGVGHSTGNGIMTAINQAHSNITIRNGTIQGMGAYGVDLVGRSLLVEQMHVTSNGDDGILADNAVVKDNIVQSNGGYGINLTSGIVSRNWTSANGGAGIAILEGTVVSNFSKNNQYGLFIFSASTAVSYIGNVLVDNILGSVSAGGVNLGQNLCNAGACPGAQF